MTTMLIARLLFFYAIVARTVAIFICNVPFRRSAWPIRVQWSWGGLRGVVAFALVLSIPIELPYWWTIQPMVFGVVYFSLFVQSTTVGLLIDKPAA